MDTLQLQKLLASLLIIGIAAPMSVLAEGTPTRTSRDSPERIEYMKRVRALTTGAVRPTVDGTSLPRSWVVRLEITGGFIGYGRGGIVVGSTKDFATSEAAGSLNIPCRGKLPVEDFTHIAELVNVVASQKPQNYSASGSCVTDGYNFIVFLRWVDEKDELQSSRVIAPMDMCSADPVPEIFFALGMSLFELHSSVAPGCTLSILPEN